MLLGSGRRHSALSVPFLGWRETLSHQRPLPLPPQPAAEPDKYLRAGRLKHGFHLLDPGQWLPLHLVFFTLIPTEARPVSRLPTHTHLPPAGAPDFPASSQQHQPQPRPSPEVSSAFLFSHWLLCSGVAPPPQVPEQSTVGFFWAQGGQSSCVSLLCVTPPASQPASAPGQVVGQHLLIDDLTVSLKDAKNTGPPGRTLDLASTSQALWVWTNLPTFSNLTVSSSVRLGYDSLAFLSARVTTRENNVDNSKEFANVGPCCHFSGLMAPDRWSIHHDVVPSRVQLLTAGAESETAGARASTSWSSLLSIQYGLLPTICFSPLCSTHFHPFPRRCGDDGLQETAQVFWHWSRLLGTEGHGCLSPSCA